MKLILLSIVMSFGLYAGSLENKYPSYLYVFNEFDVDKTYINDADFSYFVMKNEKSLHAFYKRSLKRGKEFLPTMKGKLLRDGVSDLFIYLSMVESGFSESAVSPKKAAGLWQFMPQTAKRFKLEVSETYDERYNALSSTTAAIMYLNKLHDQFGKWYLAAMAYNCGEGCLQKAIDRAGTDELRTLIDDSLKYLPRETRTYIKKILLVAMIGENSTITTMEYDYSNLAKVTISANANIEKIASLLNMKYEVLKKINHHMMQDKSKNKLKTYTLLIPIDKVFAFYLRYELNETGKSHLLSHYVKLGETLTSIAHTYGSTEIEILDTNNLDNDYLVLGQLLVIPVNKKVFEQVIVK